MACDYYGMGGRRTLAINTQRSAADSIKPAQTSCSLSAIAS